MDYDDHETIIAYEEGVLRGLKQAMDTLTRLYKDQKTLIDELNFDGY